MSISIQSLTYIHPDRVPLFSAISCSVSKGRKIALVGDNGTGKSTLLRIIAGGLQPTEGEVIFTTTPYYVPQHTGQYEHLSVAQALQVDKKLEALQAILNGDVSSGNFTLLADDWEIEERINAAFTYWGIGHINPGQSMRSLSGGEKTKVFLAGIQVHTPQVLLLDEPSNHLDVTSRKQLYDFITKSKHTILCVSHDRTLLNLFDTTFELTRNAIEVYGGNYDFYREEREKNLEALRKQREEKEKTVRKAMQKSREVAEKRRKQEARGKANAQKKALPRIVANGLKIQAEQNTARLKAVQEEKVKALSDSLDEVKEQIRRQTVLKIDLRDSGLHKGKIWVEAVDINYSYGEEKLWKEPLSLLIRSGERVSIEGDNGSGKTTLINLLTGYLSPQSGVINRADFRYLYIDQGYTLLNESLGLFEQVQQFNDRLLEEHELKMLLHIHNFPREMWDKECGKLSGGEKMKLILCCVAIKENTPDMIILDEPTNNLDIHSQEIVTRAVKSFPGTVLLISHDDYFKKEVGIDRVISLPG